MQKRRKYLDFSVLAAIPSNGAIPKWQCILKRNTCERLVMKTVVEVNSIFLLFLCWAFFIHKFPPYPVTFSKMNTRCTPPFSKMNTRCTPPNTSKISDEMLFPVHTHTSCPLALAVSAEKKAEQLSISKYFGNDVLILLCEYPLYSR
jgi:hypothetical protein